MSISPKTKIDDKIRQEIFRTCNTRNCLETIIDETENETDEEMRLKLAKSEKGRDLLALLFQKSLLSKRKQLQKELKVLIKI